MRKIKIKMGLTAAVLTAVVLICVILVNAIVSNISKKYPMKIDLTKDSVYEFSQQTKNVMKNLDEKVTAYALLPDDVQYEYFDYIEEYLDKYKAMSDKFIVQYIDPYENPSLMQKYNDGETQAYYGSVIIECGEKFKVVAFEQMYSENSFTNAVQIDLEKRVTNAIMSVTGQLTNSKIAFLTGHGEITEIAQAGSFLSVLKTEIESEGYEVSSINTAKEKIADDISMLICLAPQKDFTKAERDEIDAFVDRGGNIILIEAPGAQPLERLDSYLEEWGIVLNYDYVVETDEKHALSFGDTPALSPVIGQHSITKSFENTDSFLSMINATSMSTKKAANSAVVTELLTTSENSYGKKDLMFTTWDKEAGDIDGPLCIAAISEKSDENSGKLAFVGSVDSLMFLQEGSFLNGDFVLNLINYMAGGNPENGIRAKQVTSELMSGMTEKEQKIIANVLFYVIPLIIFLVGLIVWLRRRYK